MMPSKYIKFTMYIPPGDYGGQQLKRTTAENILADAEERARQEEEKRRHAAEQTARREAFRARQEAERQRREEEKNKPKEATTVSTSTPHPFTQQQQAVNIVKSDNPILTFLNTEKSRIYKPISPVVNFYSKLPGQTIYETQQWLFQSGQKESVATTTEYYGGKATSTLPLTEQKGSSVVTNITKPSEEKLGSFVYGGGEEELQRRASETVAIATKNYATKVEGGLRPIYQTMVSDRAEQLQDKVNKGEISAEKAQAQLDAYKVYVDAQFSKELNTKVSTFQQNIAATEAKRIEGYRARRKVAETAYNIGIGGAVTLGLGIASGAAIGSLPAVASEATGTLLTTYTGIQSGREFFKQASSGDFAGLATSTASLGVGTLGFKIGTNLVRPPTPAVKITPTVEQSIEFSKAILSDVTTDGTKVYTVEATIKTMRVDPKTGRTIEVLTTEARSLTVTAQTPEGAIKAASTTAALTLGNRGVKRMSDGKLRVKLTAQEASSQMTFREGEENTLYGTGETQGKNIGVIRLRKGETVRTEPGPFGFKMQEAGPTTSSIEKPRVPQETSGLSQGVVKITSQGEGASIAGNQMLTGQVTKGKSLFVTDIYRENIPVRGYKRGDAGSLIFGERVRPYSRAPPKQMKPQRTVTGGFGTTFEPRGLSLDFTGLKFEGPGLRGRTSLGEGKPVSQATITKGAEPAAAAATARLDVDLIAKGIKQGAAKPIIRQGIKGGSPVLTSGSIYAGQGRYERTDEGGLIAPGGLISPGRRVTIDTFGGLITEGQQRIRINEGLITEGKQRIRINEDLITGGKLRIRIDEDLKTEGEGIIDQKIMQRHLIKIEEDNKIKIRDLIRQQEQSKTRQATASALRLTPATTTMPLIGFGFEPPTYRTTIKEPPIVPINPFSQNKKQSEDFGFGYITQVKSKGRFVTLPGIRTQKGATAFGANIVDTTLSRSFRIVPTRMKVTTNREESAPLYKFRTFRQSGGRRINMPNTFIEKSKYSLERKGELPALQAARNKRGRRTFFGI